MRILFLKMWKPQMLSLCILQQKEVDAQSGKVPSFLLRSLTQVVAFAAVLA